MPSSGSNEARKLVRVFIGKVIERFARVRDINMRLLYQTVVFFGADRVRRKATTPSSCDCAFLCMRLSGPQTRRSFGHTAAALTGKRRRASEHDVVLVILRVFVTSTLSNRRFIGGKYSTGLRSRLVLEGDIG